MKTLYLVRHAKAAAGTPALPDRDRALNERGLRDAATMGQRLAQRGVKLDVLLSSPAARALATAELLAEALGMEHRDIVVAERLYNAAPVDLLQVIHGLGAAPERVMLVAHNPGLAELANHFASEIADMPTCAVAEFSFAGPWSTISKEKPVHAAITTPGDP